MIDYDELQFLLKACKNARNKAIISLPWDSGARASEVLSLKVKDFNRSADSLYATLNIEHGSKTYKHRTIVLTGDSVVLVSNWLMECEAEPEDFLFVGIGKENPGRNLNYEDLRSLLLKIWKRSGLKKKISPHFFRHTAATRLATEIPPQILMKQLG